MFCHNCGKEVANGVKYCQYCGFSVDKKQEASNVSCDESKKNAHRKKNAFGIAILIIIISLGGICILFSCEGKTVSSSSESQISNPKDKVEENGIQSIVLDESIHDVVIEKDGQVDASDASVQNIISDDIHSIWFDGIEFKILKYLNDENMVVKFPLSNYLVQAVVPRTLEDEHYISEYYSESDSSGENKEVYLKLVSGDKGDAIFFAYMQGPDIVASLIDNYEELYNQIDGEEICEVKTLNNGMALVFREGDSVAWSEYDTDDRWLPGYMLVVLNQEEQMAFAMQILKEDEKEIDKDNFEHVAFRKIEDSDYILRVGVEQADYDAKMDIMYQKYREIIENPTTYLQETCNAPGENYTLHYLFDLTGDSVPETIFEGTPRWLAIVGEKNTISMPGDEIIFSNTPNIIYTKTAFQQNVTWKKYEMQTDSGGYLVANCMETLEIDIGEVYTLNGEDITEAEYLDLLSEIEKTDRPKPQMYDADEYIASQKGFRRSVECLTNDFVFDDY